MIIYNKNIQFIVVYAIKNTYICGMKYQNIKQSKVSHGFIAKSFGYKNVNSFRCSSAHKRIMTGIDLLIEKILIDKSQLNH